MTDGRDEVQKRPATPEELRARRSRWQKIAGWLLGLGAAVVPVVAIVGVVSFVVSVMTVTVPAPEELATPQIATLTYNNGREMTRIVPEAGNRTDVPAAEIPKTIKDAIVAAEDREFWTSKGFSTRGILRELGNQIQRKPTAGGGSSITQQYVKNAIVGDESEGLAGIDRKVRELARAIKMSREWSKEDILAAYLNTIYYGRNAYGIDSAVKTYFPGTKLKDLTYSQAAVLAAVIRSPGIWDPAIDLERSKERWEYVRDGMLTTGAITQAEAAKMAYPKNKELINPPAPKTNPADKGPVGLIKRQVLEELKEIGLDERTIHTGGLTITTTIDPKVQQAAVDAAANNDNITARRESDPAKLRSAIVSIDPKSGAVRGYYGGTDGFGLDYAQAMRQTGSTFKIFAVVAALEQSIPLSRRYSSDPYTIGGVTVTNSDGDTCGVCNVATALKKSLNTSFYRLMMDLNGGPQAVADAAHQLGITAPLTYKDGTAPEYGIVLGQYETKTIDMAAALATIAASGKRYKPHFVQKVVDAKNNVLFDAGGANRDNGTQAIPAPVADNLTAAMTPIASYSGLYVDRPTAAKTGTTQKGDVGGLNQDGWTIGFTPQLATAVWVGRADSGGLTTPYGGTIYGATVAGSLWAATMNQALAGVPVEDFPNPGLVAGESGIPYEPPPVTSTPRESTSAPRSSRERPRTTTILPGLPITITPGETTEPQEEEPGPVAPVPPTRSRSR